MNTSPTILIVEDDHQLRTILEHKLTGCGYSVITAATGQQALNLLNEQAVSLILLDIILPDIDGDEVAAVIHRKGLQVPIIVLTNLHHATNIRHVNEVLIKSNTSLKKILSRINHYLDTTR